MQTLIIAIDPIGTRSPGCLMKGTINIREGRQWKMLTITIQTLRKYSDNDSRGDLESSRVTGEGPNGKVNYLKFIIRSYTSR